MFEDLRTLKERVGVYLEWKVFRERPVGGDVVGMMLGQGQGCCIASVVPLHMGVTLQSVEIHQHLSITASIKLHSFH